MRGPKFKLIHKATGLTFKQKAMRANGGIVGVNCFSPTYREEEEEMMPILLDSGYPAFYCGKRYYPYMELLPISEWDVVVKEKPCTG